MLRIMLPLATVGWQLRGAITLTSVNISVLVRVIYVLVVVVDVDVAVTPAAPPAPSSAPSGAQSKPSSKGKSAVVGRVNNWRIGIDRRPVNNGWVVSRNINHLGIGLLDHDDLLAFNGLGFDLLFLARF
jgi:hypothetical protein